jgi:hypothetical protein
MSLALLVVAALGTAVPCVLLWAADQRRRRAAA